MIGFNLIDLNGDASKRTLDAYFNYPSNTSEVRLLGLYENEVDLYGSALSNIRITHNLKDFDLERFTDISKIGKFSMTFFDFETAGPDSTGYYEVKDPAYKSCTLSANNAKFSGRLKTGYQNIDNFVNWYCVVRLDTGKVYSPLNTLFSSGENDIVSMICLFGRDLDINGLTINGPDEFIIDGETYNAEGLIAHERFIEITIRVISSVLKNSNIIAVTKEDIKPFYDKLKIASSYTNNSIVGICKVD